MLPHTARALTALNRRFYRRFAVPFDDSRQRPWPGWRRLLPHVPERRPLRLLDAGCGNGRFAHFLVSEGFTLYYQGLDDSPELLEHARNRLGPLDGLDWHLTRADLLTNPLPEGAFHWITLFGVLHHLPGAHQRLEVLQRLASRLAPGGLLAASVWQLDKSPRFEQKVLPWSVYMEFAAARGESPIAPEDVEPGDVLLTWSGEQETPRYCHFPPKEELESWRQGLLDQGLQALEPFEADGRSGSDNLYLLFRRPETLSKTPPLDRDLEP